MIKKSHLKECLNKAFNKKENNKTIFRYTAISDIDINNYPFNSKNKNIFYISYSEKKYFGIDKCIELNLESKKNILDLIDTDIQVLSYGENTDKDIKFFGSVSFDMDSNFHHSSENLQKGLFFIPKILIEKTDSYITTSFHTLLNKNIDLIIDEYSELESIIIKHESNKKFKKTKIIKKTSLPDKSDYNNIFNNYIDDINNNKYNKIVLSRTQEITLNSKLNYFDMFENMDNKCTNFLFSLNKDEKIFGSSPEKIIHLTNKKFITEAIAGTYPKTNSYTKQNLLNNKKELSEHNFVIKHLIEILKKYSSDIKISKSKTLELSHLFHIQTPIEGFLKNNIHILELLYNLYPTPAVAGYPVKNTIDKINSNEPFSRGLYSGCFGWFDQNGNGKFDVSIRCALHKKNNLILFSGGGIVKDSNFEKEWLETETKFQHLLSSIL